MLKKKIVNLDQKLKRVKISEFELKNPVVFEYFNKLSSDDRDDNLKKALYIGVLALMEDRLSAFLAKTQNELGTELESLKMIFDMKQEIFYKTAVKGMAAEDEVADFLNDYFDKKEMSDKAQTTGTIQGNIAGNKTGDVICFVEGDEGKKIVIEVKFDKSLKLGEIKDKDIFTKTKDTAWSQIIEAQVNRDARVSMIVFDSSLVDGSILKYTENIGFIKGVGFVVIVNSQKGDYSNLVIAYHLARDIVLSKKKFDYKSDILTMLLNRIIKDIEETLKVKKLVESNISNNQEILKQLEKSLLMMEFNHNYLHKFLNDGKLSKKDLLDFYNGEEIKEKFAPIEKKILALTE
ncbi:hypothetical protein ACFL0Y_01330 [Patescibacteria group bacterium]